MTFTLNPGPLHWRDWGDCHNPRIIFLHGFMGSSLDWDRIIDNLAQDYHCLAVDLPGHGKSLGLEPLQYTMAGTAQLLQKALKQQLSPQRHLADLLVGYSMGGRLALYLGLSFPQSFPQVQIISGSPGLSDFKARKARRDIDLLRCTEIRDDLKVFLRKWYRQPLFESLWKTSAQDVLIEQRLRNNPEELGKSLKYLGLGSQPSLWGKLPNSASKLHQIAGELDPKFVAISREMANCYPALDLRVLPNVGHNIPLENPIATVAEIRRTMKGRSDEHKSRAMGEDIGQSQP